uniref:Interferon-related developmental regulator N-terminal domain-containing protein n=1 Tax=Odontella aurita TaxID=265563 RepID=A0A7S4J5Q3_9STRA|mmetsp:Transcript_39271/g.118116  ORF Transcript_39271/g.118116 Transcript_39271/m.118116 type:complete len:355 (+) Transcript_39271:169-1233(+)
MPKKPRSQRRKKGTCLSADVDGDRENGDVDVLSEDHTVADSVSVQSFVDDFETGDEVDFDSASDEASASRAAISAAARQTNLGDALSLASTIPTEKRSAKREQHLRKLFKAITQYATGEQGRESVYAKLDDIVIPACFAGLRGGIASPAEQYAACRVLEATSIIIGGDMDDYCEAIDDQLRKTIKATGRASMVRGAALRALCMAHFICGTDMSATNSVLDLCEAVCAAKYRGEEVNPTLRAIALDSWALLSTTVADAYIAGDELGGVDDSGRGIIILPILQECLNHTSVELRSAGGECVALIHEARLNLGINDDEGENATERRYRRGKFWDMLQILSSLEADPPRNFNGTSHDF